MSFPFVARLKFNRCIGQNPGSNAVNLSVLEVRVNHDFRMMMLELLVPPLIPRTPSMLTFNIGITAEALKFG
ncbi:hypothetical protein CU100_07325 [Phyllobacterium endophyticum]|uniref:Uncharacterized protein n=1 Tax=Phyllobacterium endophyticum TaxID=1149773 RepID=A0A2P7B1X4_9HYPH|nr:hypothetical protein CU100_07325 [Phyllobacterium endophyticum]